MLALYRKIVICTRPLFVPAVLVSILNLLNKIGLWKGSKFNSTAGPNNDFTVFRRLARNIKPINLGLFALHQNDNPITTLLVLPFYNSFEKRPFIESWLALLFSLLCSKLKSESLVFCNFLMRKYETVWKIRSFTLKIFKSFFQTKIPWNQLFFYYCEFISRNILI